MHVQLIAFWQSLVINCSEKPKLKKTYHLKVSSEFRERFSIHNESNLEKQSTYGKTEWEL